VFKITSTLIGQMSLLCNSILKNGQYPTQSMNKYHD
jgi:hypothetical protein